MDETKYFANTWTSNFTNKYVTYPSLSILQGFKYMYDAGNMPCKKHKC
jgi:hypothetical protein